MSAYEIPIVRLITTRLSQLLKKARQIKPSNSIEPPLPIPEIEEHTNSIAVPEGPNDQSIPQQAALETVARNLLFQILSAYNINDPDFVNVWNLLDILQSCADNKQCEAALPLWVIEELLDSQTIEGCSKVFDYLESRRERLVRVSTSQPPLTWSRWNLTSHALRTSSVKANNYPCCDPATNSFDAFLVPKRLFSAAECSSSYSKAFRWATKAPSTFVENFIRRM